MFLVGCAPKVTDGQEGRQETFSGAKAARRWGSGEVQAVDHLTTFYLAFGFELSIPK